ncbi:MAG: hypothetical protein JW765_05340 [Deltaproteobacteria bacterium]|nr:hypothetical protein [Candidatus Zymogenaceae bacterium]
MTSAIKTFQVLVAFHQTETVTFSVKAGSKKEALQKAMDFDYIDVDYDPYIGDDNVKYDWEDAEVEEG